MCESGAGCSVSPCVCLPDNPRQSSHVPVYIRLLDINDNAPTFATTYETYVCERTKAGQVLQLYHFQLLESRNIVLYNQNQKSEKVFIATVRSTYVEFALVIDAYCIYTNKHQ